MKKSLLLTVAALTAVSMSAQTDVTPKNWKFSEMPVGSAESIFIREGASLNWNIKSPNSANWYNKGADGGCAVSNWIADDAPDSYASDAFTDEYKQQFEDFYQAASIVNAGSENILCLIGSDAQATYVGGTKAPSMPCATLFWLSGDNSSNLALDKPYRFTIEYRIITTQDYVGDNTMQLQFQNASFYGVSNDGDVHSSNIDLYKAVADAGVWNKAMLDFNLVDTKDAAQPTLPMAVKMNVIAQFNSSVFLFRSFKLEQIDAIEHSTIAIERSDFKDNPSTGVNEIFTNDVIVTAANGNITVIDANAPIEVYNIAGAKVATVATPSTVEAIDLDMNGVFVVKVGDKVQKVIL